MLGEGGDQFLARRVEQSLLGKALLEFLEGELQCTQPFGQEPAGDELILSAPLVNAHIAERDDLQSVPKRELNLGCDATKQHHGQLGVGVLQREIDVSGGRRAEIGNLAFDPQAGKLLFEQVLDASRQVGNAEDLCRRLWHRSVSSDGV